MNWMGAGLRAIFGALLGAVLGAWIFVIARARGVDMPPIVGLLTGIGAALGSREKNGMRGVVVSAVAVYCAAAAEVLSAPHQGFVADMLAFHERLTPVRFMLYLGCTAVCILVASSRAPWSATVEERTTSRDVEPRVAKRDVET